jgi:hypothetical protein
MELPIQIIDVAVDEDSHAPRAGGETAAAKHYIQLRLKGRVSS